MPRTLVLSLSLTACSLSAVIREQAAYDFKKKASYALVESTWVGGPTR
jgi:hypothetical protein